MSDIKIIRIVREKELISILNSFKKTLYSLENELIDIHDYSNKIIKHGYIYTCYLQDEIIGFCTFYANDNINKKAFLSMIAVNENFRKLKIGTILLNKVIEVAILNGMSELGLSVRRENLSAINFYKKNKFIFTNDFENDYYHMSRKLI